ncbi:hypothetical protein [Parafilimonas sp.]|uniref:hypothetical protein n=1 Tax=Parafilimonas sp. TaxID=1969739 RepID=UPI003F7FF0C1
MAFGFAPILRFDFKSANEDEKPLPSYLQLTLGVKQYAGTTAFSSHAGGESLRRNDVFFRAQFVPEQLKTRLYLHKLLPLFANDPPNKGVKASSGIGVKIKNGMGVKQSGGIYSFLSSQGMCINGTAISIHIEILYIDFRIRPFCFIEY